MIQLSTQQMMRRILWIARGISVLIAAFWLFILFANLAFDLLVGFICLDWEMGLLVGLVTGTILSVLAAWWNEGIGGILLILWGVAFAGITYLTSCSQLGNLILAASLPFLVDGGLFFATWLGRMAMSTQV
jgi:hypothetical protein